MTRLVEACPECRAACIWERRKKTPRYACRAGHTFEEPIRRKHRTETHEPREKIASAELFEVCWRAYRAGEVAAGNGGVTRQYFASQLPVSEGTVINRCRRLVNEGVLEIQPGLNPVSGQWYDTYAPTALVDNSSDSYPTPEAAVDD